MKLDELRKRLRAVPTAKPERGPNEALEQELLQDMKQSTGPASEMREADAPCATCGERYHTDLDLPTCYSCRLEDLLRRSKFGIVMKVPK